MQLRRREDAQGQFREWQGWQGLRESDRHRQGLRCRVRRGPYMRYVCSQHISRKGPSPRLSCHVSGGEAARDRLAAISPPDVCSHISSSHPCPPPARLTPTPGGAAVRVQGRCSVWLRSFLGLPICGGEAQVLPGVDRVWVPPRCCGAPWPHHHHHHHRKDAELAPDPLACCMAPPPFARARGWLPAPHGCSPRLGSCPLPAAPQRCR